MYDKVVEGRILSDGVLKDSFICLENGKIVKVARTKPSNGEIGDLISFGRKMILPGVIDSHVHMRDPGLTHKEDFHTGSISAAFGGVTSFIDMPNTLPPTLRSSDVRGKIENASRSSLVDFAFNLCITTETPESVVDEALNDIHPPAGLKAFMGESTGKLTYGPFEDLGRWGSFLKERSTPLCIHAEDGSEFIKSDLDESRILSSHNSLRPPVSEASAILKTQEAMKRSLKNVHFLHVSTESGFKMAKGKDCTIEITPHHLFLDIKKLEKNLEHQALGKVNPPIRKTSDRAALMSGIRDGSIFTMGSDHAPHTWEEKTEGSPPPSGMPGIETMLPLMLDAVFRGQLLLNNVQDLLCRNPADRFSLEDRGSLEPGKQADLVVIDMSEPRRIRAEDLHSRCGWTAYEGMTGIFPEAVFSRGDLIIENDVLCTRNGRGKCLL